MFYISLQEEILDILAKADNQEMDFEGELLEELENSASGQAHFQS